MTSKSCAALVPLYPSIRAFRWLFVYPSSLLVAEHSSYAIQNEKGVDAQKRLIREFYQTVEDVDPN